MQPGASSMSMRATLGAGLFQQRGGRLADALGRAGNESRFAFQVEEIHRALV
jgi:hypothetical protein